MSEPNNQALKLRRRSRFKSIPKVESTPIVQEAWQKGLFLQLKPRQQAIIKRRYGIEGERETLEKIGEELGISRERVRQLEIRAERKLKAILLRLKKQIVLTS